MCCMRLAGNTGHKNDAKIAICAPSHNFVRLYLRNWGMYRQSEKNFWNSNSSSRCLHNMANFGPLTAEIRWRVSGTSPNFNGFRVLASLLQRRRSPQANLTLHDVWPSRGLVHYMYIFRAVAPWRNFARCIIHFACKSSVIVYWHTVLLHSTPAAGLSQTLRRGTRNGITELSQTAPPIFGWAAITLGIGPHSSFSSFIQRSDMTWWLSNLFEQCRTVYLRLHWPFTFNFYTIRNGTKRLKRLGRANHARRFYVGLFHILLHKF